MTGAELPMAISVELAMAVGAAPAGAVCVGAELTMAAGAELAHGRAVLARSELAPPPWLELEYRSCSPLPRPCVRVQRE